MLIDTILESSSFATGTCFGRAGAVASTSTNSVVPSTAARKFKPLGFKSQVPFQPHNSVDASRPKLTDKPFTSRVYPSSTPAKVDIIDLFSEEAESIQSQWEDKPKKVAVSIPEETLWTVNWFVGVVS